MHKLLIKIALAPLALFLATGLGQAQVILFSNGSATSASIREGADTGGGADSMAGDVFTPTQSGTANEMSFAGTFVSFTLPTTNSFTLSLYSLGAGNAPSNSTLISTSTLTSVTQTDLGFAVTGGLYEAYEFTGTLSTPFTLSTSSSYYLGISDTDTPTEDFALITSPTGTATTSYIYYSGPHVFSESPDYPLSFTVKDVEAAVPEPSTWALVLGGLGALALFRLRRRVKA